MEIDAVRYVHKEIEKLQSRLDDCAAEMGERPGVFPSFFGLGVNQEGLLSKENEEDTYDSGYDAGYADGTLTTLKKVLKILLSEPDKSKSSFEKETF